MTDDEDPYADAACIDADSDIFFPHRDPTQPWVSDETLYAAAKRYCAMCPIRRMCLDDHRRERFGMWGGTTPAERGFGRHRSRRVIHS